MIHLELIKKYADANPAFVVFKTKDTTMTWSEFRKKTEEKILFLLKHYDRNLPRQASYVTRNRIDLLPWLSALATLGIPVTGLDYTLPPGQLKAMNVAIGSELVLLSSRTMSTDNVVSLGQSNAMLIDLDSITSSFSGVLDNDITDVLEFIASRDLPKRPYRAVGFTSGTSGSPKPVIRDTPFDQRRFAYFTERYQFSGNDRFLSVMPLYHAAGNGWVRLFLSLGASIFIDTYDSPAALRRVLETERITATVMTPIMLNGLVDSFPGDARAALPSLRWLLIGGKHLNAQLKLRALSVLGPSLHEYYGTTETGVNTLADPDDLLKYPGSVGHAYDGNSVLVVDSDGRPVPAGVSGTVVIDSYMNMLSYAGGNASQLQIDGQRYLVTPEQGYLDQDGRLYLLNRTQEPGNVANLYRLEDTIRTLPNVGDVAILPFKGGNIPGLACAVSLKTACPNEPILIDKVRSLAALESITFEKCAVVPSIPYSPSGKVRVAEVGALLTQ
jgi:acyl-coenzyme A synthetase/AMP-(fatty) acid ligase